MTPEERAKAYDVLVQSLEHNQQVLIKAVEDRQRYERALRAIIARADDNSIEANGSLGTSKVQDMRRLAAVALGEE